MTVDKTENKKPRGGGNKKHVGTDPLMLKGEKDIAIDPTLAQMFPHYVSVMNEELQVGTKDCYWYIGKGNAILIYVDARIIIDMCNRAFGCMWSNEPRIMDTSKGLIFMDTIKLLYNTPDGQKQHLKQHTGVADATGIEGIKGGASDALKRTAVYYFPQLQALYDGPKVKWTGTKKAEDVEMHDLYDLLDGIMRLFYAGNILPKRKVEVYNEGSKYLAKYYDYKEEKWTIIQDGKNVGQEKQPEEKKVEDKKEEDKKDAPATNTEPSAYEKLKTKYLGKKISVKAEGKTIIGTCVEYTTEMKEDFIAFIKSGANNAAVKFFLKGTVAMFAQCNDKALLFPIDSADVKFYMNSWKFAEAKITELNILS